MGGEERIKSLLERLGWDLDSHSKRVDDIIKNKKICRNLLLTDSIISHERDERVRPVGNLLFEFSSRVDGNEIVCFSRVIEWILDGKVKCPQLEAIILMLKENPKTSPDTLECQCGVGIFVDYSTVKETIEGLIAGRLEELRVKRYQMVSTFHAELRELLRWADRGMVNRELNEQMVRVIGPKGENEVQKNVKITKNSKKVAIDKETGDSNGRMDSNAMIEFPDPRNNLQVIPELLEAHLRVTNGIVITRFPPEPNGYLHLGHAKSMNLNFGYAKKKGGVCYLRFDDTNPSVETREYFDAILEAVEWFGHKPYKVTYASDYFDQMYDLAVELIKKGKAYVCKQKSDEYRGSWDSKNRLSIWRDLPVAENLALFEDMKNGKFEQGEIVLRMKMDLDSPNPCMWDPVAYRIKYHSHPRSLDRWCIYPSYDFAHCINDSFENVTHSLCTLEYVGRKESYNWLLDALGMYKPLVWEYARLNVTYTVLSKRVLSELVSKGVVRGWDDPRMPTISGLRRRGYTVRAINNFCEDIGVTRADNVSIPIERLEQSLRDDLDPVCIRAMAVIDPLKVVITNLNEVLVVKRENVPGYPERGHNHVTLTNTIYIERQDFRIDDIKKYYGLALNTKDHNLKWVRLRYGPPIAIIDVLHDENQKISELKAIFNFDVTRTSGTIHWVSAPDGNPSAEPFKAEFRLYETLFKSEKVSILKDKMSDLNPNSETVTMGYIDSTALELQIGDHLQFERLGFFVVDKDSFKPPSNHLVFNRSVKLNEAKDKPK